MQVGVALPQMAEGLDGARLRRWCAAVDAGPFSSVSAGERITFHNLDGFTLCAAAAALTERVRVLVNVVVLPWHAPALVAKELASMDVVSGGRLDVAVGVGGRQQDYAALGSPFGGRHRRLDESVHELRRLWTGGPAADGESVGPAPAQPGGPRIFASAMGPKSMTRCANWADGVSGFTLLADGAEVDRMVVAARTAWGAAARPESPRLITGSFAALGTRDDAATLRSFAAAYLRVFSPQLADQLSAKMPLHDPAAVSAALRVAAATGCDEFIVVPATSDPAMVDALTDVVTDLVHEGIVTI